MTEILTAVAAPFVAAWEWLWPGVRVIIILSVSAGLFGALKGGD